MPRFYVRSVFPLVVLSSLAIVFAGCSAQTAPTAKSASRSPAVKTVAVVEQEVRRTTSQPATVHAYYQAEIWARVSGYVAKLNVDIGDYVEAGQSLAEIAVPEMEQQRRISEARIDRFRAQEEQAESGVELAQANVQSSEANLQQARSELNRAEASLAAMEAEFARTEDLVGRQSLERRLLDEVRKKRDSELANRQAVASAILSAEADVTVANARLAAAEADLRAAKADTVISQRQLDEIDVLMDYAMLRAPFAGVITARGIDPGDLANESNNTTQGKPLFVLSRVDRVRVQIPVPEGDAALVNPGDEVTITFPSFSGEQIITTVTRVAGSLESSTRTMLVEAELDNPQRKLLPGMFGIGSITLQSKAAANMLPARSVRFDESGGAYVYVVGSDDTISVVSIDTGMDNGHQIEVVSGVESGQWVVDAHLQRFVNGQKVTVLPN